MIITTNRIRQPYDAFTVWPFIFIRPGYRANVGLIAHEMVHYRSQAWLTPLWLLWYLVSKDFRWCQEVKGYKAQIAAGGIHLDDAVRLLCTYDTGHTPEQARFALGGE